jgi:hypothetical protein
VGITVVTVARSATEATVYQNRDLKGQFKKGNSVGRGRPKGARNKLAESFLADAEKAWRQHGKKALERMALDAPAKFWSVMASILPKEMLAKLEVSATESAVEMAKEYNEAYRLMLAAKTLGMREPLLIEATDVPVDDGPTGT